MLWNRFLILSFLTYIFIMIHSFVLQKLLYVKITSIYIYGLLGSFLLSSIIFLLLGLYLGNFLKYDISRLDTKETNYISRYINLIPFFLSFWVFINILALSVLEYRLSKSYSEFVYIFIVSIPVIFLVYYISNSFLFHLKVRGFSLVKRVNQYGFVLSFILLITFFIFIILFYILLLSRSKLFGNINNVFILSYIINSFFLATFALIYYISNSVRILSSYIKTSDFPPKLYVPSSNELGLLVVGISSILPTKEIISQKFPVIRIGDKTIRINEGRNQYGIVYLKLYDLQEVKSYIAEEIISLSNNMFRRIESFAFDQGGYIFRMNGNELYLAFGVDNSDPFEGILSFAKSLYREVNSFGDPDNVLSGKNITLGASVGEVIVGSFDSLNGVYYYFFGESVSIASIVAKIPNKSGFFFSEEFFKFYNGIYDFRLVSKVKIKDTDTVVEIYEIKF